MVVLSLCFLDLTRFACCCAEDKLTCLDKFRLLITHIGNALGYVRMVRSAGMHHSAEAVAFVPDISKVPEFEACVKGEVKSAKEAVVGMDDWFDEDWARGVPLPVAMLMGSCALCDVFLSVRESSSWLCGWMCSAGGGGGGAEDDADSATVSLSEEAVEAGRILDSVLANLTGSFSSAADYFKVRGAATTCSQACCGHGVRGVCYGGAAVVGGHVPVPQ